MRAFTEFHQSVTSTYNQLGRQIHLEVEGHDRCFEPVRGGRLRFLWEAVKVGLLPSSMRHYFLSPDRTDGLPRHYVESMVHGSGYMSVASANGYEPMMRILLGDGLIPARRGLAEALGPVGDGLIVDFGAGAGNVFPALRAAHPRAPILGFELSPYMVAFGRHTTLRQVAGAELREGSVTDRLPLADATAAGVTAAFLFHEMRAQDIASALGEAHRVLRPGGRIVILDGMFDQRPLQRALVRIAARVLREPFLREFSLLDLRAALTSAGFRGIAQRHGLARGIIGLTVAEKPAA